MMKILTQKYLKEHFDYSPFTGSLLWKKPTGPRVKVGDRAGYFCGGYMRIEIFGSRRLGHRVIWLMHHGEEPEGQIDHINGIRDDNRISNLRCVSQHENLKNKSIYKNNTSGVIGVCWHKGNKKWRVTAAINKKPKTVGYFDDMELAELVSVEVREMLGYHKNHGISRT